MITAPYNFVPLSEKVFFPPWVEQVNHDIPFSDGESGEIDITITAKSPIFIRDGKKEEEFCHHTNKEGNKTHYIPGSSIKGMVRNVLEIMSFSKMKFVDDKTYKKNNIEQYQHSIHYGLPDSHKSRKLDISEILFGYNSDKLDLKGRLQFSHFSVLEDTCICYRDSVKYILGTPKASYYPIYINQNGSLFDCTAEQHVNYDEDFKIAGWKRYPVHKNHRDTFGECTEDDTTSTCFKPLREGVKFNGKIRYHNLKECELGALLSAITFHNTDNTFHNIGLAKSFGFGKVSLVINNVISKSNLDDKNLLSKVNISDYLRKFEWEITKDIDDWAKSVQIQELVTMATEQNNLVDNHLVYMSLHDGDNTYVNNKEEDSEGRYSFLCNYSKLENVSTNNVISLLSGDDIKELMSEKEILYAEKEKTSNKESEKRIFVIKEESDFEMPSNKKMKKAIEVYIKDKLDFTLPKYYDLSHFSLFLKNDLETLDDNFESIKNEYKKLSSISSCSFVVELLKKREYGEATEDEIGVLYYLLTHFEDNGDA